MPSTQQQRVDLLRRRFRTETDLPIAEAVVRHLQHSFGQITPENAWKFIVASVTYFQDTPGGSLPRIPNLTDFSRLWNKDRQRPGTLYQGAVQIANKLASHFGANVNDPTGLDALETRLSAYFRLRAWVSGRGARVTGRSLNNAQQRNTWVGDGFEQLLFVLTHQHLGNVGLPDLRVLFKVTPEQIVGFQLRTGGGRQRFPVSDLAIANPLLRAVISAKVGLRVDRTRGELDAALTLARVRPETRYLVVTSEYDTAFLRLLASEPAIGRVYHVNKDYLLDFWDHIPNTEERPWIITAVGDLSDYFNDIVTLSKPAM